MDKLIEIVFLEDENGKQQVVQEIARISKLGEVDEGYASLSRYIRKALTFLKDTGVPSEKKTLPFTTQRIDGTLLTFASIIKELKHHPPLMEFRINWRYTGYFRAIFFYTEDDKGNQTIYFTKAIVKMEKNPPEFLKIIIESESMLEKFKKGLI